MKLGRRSAAVTWLSHLSFAQALRWALLWPITILAATAVAWYAVMASGAVISVRVEPAGPPLWLALTLVALLALLGPPAVFLAVWKLARR
jgi:hypothetical protein